MAENSDNSSIPTSERIAAIRAHLQRLRNQLGELQRNAPLPLPPRPPAAPDLAEPAAVPITQETSPGLHLPTPTPGTALAVMPPSAHAVVAPPVKPIAWTPARRARNGFELALTLAQRPGFCCGCLCLGPHDTRRARRIFALVRAIRRAERAASRRR